MSRSHPFRSSSLFNDILVFVVDEHFNILLKVGLGARDGVLIVFSDARDSYFSFLSDFESLWCIIVEFKLFNSAPNLFSIWSDGSLQFELIETAGDLGSRTYECSSSTHKDISGLFVTPCGKGRRRLFWWIQMNPRMELVVMAWLALSKSSWLANFDVAYWDEAEIARAIFLGLWRTMTT